MKMVFGGVLAGNRIITGCRSVRGFPAWHESIRRSPGVNTGTGHKKDCVGEYRP